MKIALLGTRGVPARYGGFETAVEEIGAGLAEHGHDVTVYCRSNNDAPPVYRGMRRVVLPALHRTALETITHTGLSTLHAMAHRPDAAIGFIAANAPYVEMLRAARIPTALHIDGHDARREKWRGIGSRYYSWATRFGCSVASQVIVDSKAIGCELRESHEVEATYIPYGARRTTAAPDLIAQRLASVQLAPDSFHLVVARFEPENHVLDIVRGYSASDAQLPLVVVGFEGYPGDYTRSIVDVARADRRIRLTGPVWDQDLLDALYAGAASYLHGHSVGGTNPSLLRAMVHGTPVIAYDCPYNRETCGGEALWFATQDELCGYLADWASTRRNVVAMAASLSERASDLFTWSRVVDAYDELAEQLKTGRRAQPVEIDLAYADTASAGTVEADRLLEHGPQFRR